jgi:hypothetical protein
VVWVQSPWLQIQRSGFDSRRFQIFWEVISLERGTLSLVITIEELLKRKSSGSGLENSEYGRRIRHADHLANLSEKIGTNFADKPRPLGQYRSLVDSGHGVLVFSS